MQAHNNPSSRNPCWNWKENKKKEIYKCLCLCFNVCLNFKSECKIKCCNCFKIKVYFILFILQNRISLILTTNSLLSERWKKTWNLKRTNLKFGWKKKHSHLHFKKLHVHQMQQNFSFKLLFLNFYRFKIQIYFANPERS